MAWWKSGDKSAAAPKAAAAQDEQPASADPWAAAAATAGMDAAALRDFLDWWVESMDVRLLHFRDFVLDGKVTLDYSPESLDVLEELVLQRYPGGTAPDFAGDKDFLEGMMRYLGETHRRAYGGEWTVGSDPDVHTFGEIIVSFRAPVMPLVPRIELTALVAKQSRGAWGRVLRGQEAWLNDARAERVGRGLPADDPAWGLPSKAGADSTVPARGGTGAGETVEADLSSPPDREAGQAFLTWWLATMPEALERFRQALDPATAQQFDESPGTLHALARMLLEKYPDEASFLAASRSGDPVADGAVRYFGEVVKRHIPGYWMYHPGRADDPNTSLGRPFVVSDHRAVSSTPEDDLGLVLEDRDLTLLDALVRNLSEG